jgi:hypothetical protein
MLNRIKPIARRIPLVPYVYRLVRDTLSPPPPPPTTEGIFTNIFKENAWMSEHSVSGLGSEPDQTKKLVVELPKLFRQLNISTMLDIPCGDFNWMHKVDLDGIKYLGADIVKDIVQLNQRYRTPSVDFVCLNLISEPLPEVDLIFCRDCLVHLSYADIFRALKNIVNSGSTYLLTTTFPERTANWDIPTGEWRVLNLEAAPFSFPRPELLIVEGCTEDEGKYADKALGLWKISELQKLFA